MHKDKESLAALLSCSGLDRRKVERAPLKAHQQASLSVKITPFHAKVQVETPWASLILATIRIRIEAAMALLGSM